MDDSFYLFSSYKGRRVLGTGRRREIVKQTFYDGLNLAWLFRNSSELLVHNAKEQQINAENKVSKLEQRGDNLQQEKVYLVDEVFNLNSRLEKK